MKKEGLGEEQARVDRPGAHSFSFLLSLRHALGKVQGGSPQTMEVGCQGLLRGPRRPQAACAASHSPGLVAAGVLVQKGAERIRPAFLGSHPDPVLIHVEGPQRSQTYEEKRNI